MGPSKNSPPFGRLACFHVTITGNVECFLYFNFKISFLKNETLFEKTGVPFMTLFTVFESTKIENATFPWKNTLSKANFKIN